MPKDPAVLFYTSDFLSGTFCMSNEQVGKYIRLLCLQHQKGMLTEKDMLNICQTYDVDIFEKFTKKDNFFYNERMFNESERRKSYSDSRKNNRLRHKNNIICQSYDKHMETETETETETITVAKTKTEKKAKKNQIITLPWSDHAFVMHWDLWKEYKDEQFKFKYMPSSEQTALKQLAELAEGKSDTAVKIILQSMGKGWRGLFELRINENGNSKTNQTRVSSISDKQLHESLIKRFG
jgi:hypothetical protein